MASNPKGNGNQPKPQEATALLRADHKLVSELFEDYEKARVRGKKQALAEREYAVHLPILPRQCRDGPLDVETLGPGHRRFPRRSRAVADSDLRNHWSGANLCPQYPRDKGRLDTRAFRSMPRGLESTHASSPAHPPIVWTQGICLYLS